MPLSGGNLGRVVQSVFQLLEQRHRNRVEPCMLSQDRIKPSVKQAFEEAFRDAYEHFYKKQEEYLQLFNISFWERGGADFLARLFLVDDQPGPSDLALKLALSLNSRQPGSQGHIHYVRDQEQIAVDWLTSMLRSFEKYPDLVALKKSETLWARTTLLERIIVLILAHQGKRVYERLDIDRALREQSSKAFRGEEVDRALRRLVDLRHILHYSGTSYTL